LFTFVSQLNELKTITITITTTSVWEKSIATFLHNHHHLIVVGRWMLNLWRIRQTNKIIFAKIEIFFLECNCVREKKTKCASFFACDKIMWFLLFFSKWKPFTEMHRQRLCDQIRLIFASIIVANSKEMRWSRFATIVINTKTLMLFQTMLMKMKMKMDSKIFHSVLLSEQHRRYDNFKMIRQSKV